MPVRGYSSAGKRSPFKFARGADTASGFGVLGLGFRVWGFGFRGFMKYLGASCLRVTGFKVFCLRRWGFRGWGSMGLINKLTSRLGLTFT